jgi:hypothetical protein
MLVERNRGVPVIHFSEVTVFETEFLAKAATAQRTSTQEIFIDAQ